MHSNDSEDDQAQRACFAGAGAHGAMPPARPVQCTVEVTQTLKILSDAGGAVPRLSVTGPAGFSQTLDDAEIFVDVGMPIGEYRFEGAAGGHAIKGGFTVARASRRIVRLKYKDRHKRQIDQLVIAGFQSRTELRLMEYHLTTQAPGPRGVVRSWRYAQEFGDVTADDRGEASLDIPDTALPTDADRLIVSEPRQQNSLNAARITVAP